MFLCSFGHAVLCVSFASENLIKVNTNVIDVGVYFNILILQKRYDRSYKLVRFAGLKVCCRAAHIVTYHH